MRILILILLFPFSQYTWAQFTGHTNALNITGSQNTLKSEIPLARPSVIGSTYLDEKWQTAEIILKNGYVINNVPLRVEIEEANIEIQYNGEVKYLSLRDVDSVNFVDAFTGLKYALKNADQFASIEGPRNGVVLLSTGQHYRTLKHFYIEFLRANYNVAMDVGSKDHKKVKRNKLYISYEGRLTLIRGSNKKIIEQLTSDKDKAQDIIKKYKLNLSEETDLIKFMTLLES